MNEETPHYRMMMACQAGDMASLGAARWTGVCDLFKELSETETMLFSGVLTTAVNNGDYEAVKEALAAGASLEWLDYRGVSPLMSMVEIKNCFGASFLIEAGANVNATSRRRGSVFGQAVSSGSVEMVELLLWAGADMEACDEMGDTVLMSAVR